MKIEKEKKKSRGVLKMQGAGACLVFQVFENEKKVKMCKWGVCEVKEQKK